MLDGNARAAAFYESHGWHADSGRKVEEGMHEVRRVRSFAERLGSAPTFV